MSIPAMNAVFGLGEKNGLTATQQLVLLVLADNADDNGLCWPGQRLVGKKSGRGRRTVRRTIEELEEGGWITPVALPGRDYPGYQLHLPTLDTPTSCGGGGGREARPGGREARPLPGNEGRARRAPGGGRASSAGGREARPEPSVTTIEPSPPAAEAPRSGDQETAGAGTAGGDEFEFGKNRRGGLGEKLRELGVNPRKVTEILERGDGEVAWQRIEEFEAAVDAGEKVDAGLLVSAILGNYPITTKGKGRKSPTRTDLTRYGLYRCEDPECRAETIRKGIGLGIQDLPDVQACWQCRGRAKLVRELKREEVTMQVET